MVKVKVDGIGRAFKFALALLALCCIAWVSLEEFGSNLGKQVYSSDTVSLKQKKRDPFNPFTDIQFGPVQVFHDAVVPLTTTEGNNNPRHHYNYYSSRDCVATGSQMFASYQTEKDSKENRRPNYMNRSCKYRNLYYRPKDQTFHYFASPAEQRAYAESITAGDEEFFARMQVSIDNLFENTEKEQLENMFRIQPWSPQIHTEPNDYWNATFSLLGTKERSLVFELFRPFHGFNLGHLIWDDFNVLFSLLYRFGLTNYDSIQQVPFYVELYDVRGRKNFGGGDPLWRCGPANPNKWIHCVKKYRKFYPALFGIQADCSGDLLRTGNWLLGNEAIGAWPGHPQENCSKTYANIPPDGAEYVLLPEAVVGAGRLSQVACQGDCTIFQGQAYLEMRNFFMYNLFGGSLAAVLQETPPKGYITFSLPIGSSRPKEVHMFDKEVELAEARYGKEAVKVVDMADLTMQEQARLVWDSAVYITNHGGGSSTSMFLQNGAAALIFWHGEKRFDHSFYEASVYFRTHWVGVAERPFVDRTMALIEQEVEQAARKWPDLLCRTSIRRH